MAYADAQSLQQKTAGMAGAALAHAALGGLILVGLSVTNVINTEDFAGPLPTRDWKEPPPPPPEPSPEPKLEKPKVQKPVFVPDPPVTLTTEQPFTRTIPDLPPPGPIEHTIPKTIIDDPGPGLAAIQPKPASPRNDPARWITERDYKSRWIREEMFGRASFKLDIGANGRVENCTITRSTGHNVLDRATCELITKRARFKNAETSDGAATSGTYTSAIRWQLPD